MTPASQLTFEVTHEYSGFDQQKFWDFFVDYEWHSKSGVMPAETVLNKHGERYPQGVGAIRTIKMANNMNFVEDIVGYEPPHHFAYTLKNSPLPVNSYRGDLFFENTQAGMALRYIGSFSPKYFGTGWVLRWFLRSNIAKMRSIWETGYKAYYNE